MLALISSICIVGGVVTGFIMAKGYLLPGSYYLWKEDKEAQELDEWYSGNPFKTPEHCVCPQCQYDSNKWGSQDSKFVRYMDEQPPYVITICPNCGYKYKRLKKEND